MDAEAERSGTAAQDPGMRAKKTDQEPRWQDLSLQQKIWLCGRVSMKALAPLAVYVLVPAVCLSIGYVFFHADMTAQEFFTYGGNFYSAVGMVLTIYILHRRSKARGNLFFDDATLYLERADWKLAAACAVFGFLAALACSAILTLLPRFGMTEAYTASSRTMFSGQDILFTMVTVALTSPFAEEIIFRGYMLNTFLEVFDEKVSVIVVSALFAVCHGNLLWIIYAFFMGLVLGLLSVWEDNILYGIFMHMGFNLLSALIWLAEQHEGVCSLFFGSRWLVASYAAIGCLACVLMAGKYLEGKG